MNLKTQFQGFANPATVVNDGGVKIAVVYGTKQYETASVFAAAFEMQDALQKAEAILSQLQDNPEKAVDIIRQGYFGHALVRARSALVNSRIDVTPAIEPQTKAPSGMSM